MVHAIKLRPASESIPEGLEYCPAGHGVQEVAPVVVDIVLILQYAQEDAPTADEPGLGAYRPAGQGMHAEPPVKVLYVPPGQGVHTVAFPVEYVPAGQEVALVGTVVPVSGQ